MVEVDGGVVVEVTTHAGYHVPSLWKIRDGYDGSEGGTG